MQPFNRIRDELAARKASVQRQIELRKKEAEMARREREQAKIEERKNTQNAAFGRLKRLWR